MDAYLSTDLRNVRTIRRAVEIVATEAGMDEAHLDDVSLAVSEAVTNAFHAQESADTDLPAPMPVRVRVGVAGCRLCVTVSNHSPGFATATEEDDDPLKEAGHGLELMREVAERIDFFHEVRMWFCLTDLGADGMPLA